jgi:uncharacterized surface protein with fasciclin (FAS1) repeats
MQNKMVYLPAFVFLCYFSIACRNTKNKDTSAKPSSSTIADSKASSSKTIAENIISDSSHTVLAKALNSTELIETLKKPGPFTVFTPTNEAFNKLPEGVFESLMNKRKNEFINILSYHIVAGAIRANDLKDGEKLKTLAGEELTVSVRNDKLMINGTNVIETDIESSNGMIHVIDGLLFPRNQNAAVY